MGIKVMQLHKRSAYVYENIQDKYAISNDGKIIAISDGATQGYRSELWAEILTKSFLKSPVFDVDSFFDFLHEQVLKFISDDLSFDGNFAIKALNNVKKGQGGFATFLACCINKDGSDLHYISYGDSCLFIENKGVVTSFPFSSEKELDNELVSIGTKHLENGTFSKKDIHIGTISLEPFTKIYLMTDAIARLTFKNKSILKEIDSLKNFDQLKLFIETNWEHKLLEEDDITIIKWDSERKRINNHIIIPPIDFSYPKEEEIMYVRVGESIGDSESVLHLKNENVILRNENEKLKRTLKLYKRLAFTLVFVIFLMIAFPNIKKIYHDTTSKIEKIFPSINKKFKDKRINNNGDNTEIKSLKKHPKSKVIEDNKIKTENNMESNRNDTITYDISIEKLKQIFDQE